MTNECKSCLRHSPVKTLVGLFSSKIHLFDNVDKESAQEYR